jgi:methylmalonyl-CoA/ethylmalonyl-CoA epimerase
VYVTDLERSVAFYREVFGLEAGASFTLGDERIAFLAAGAGWVELIQDRSHTGSPGRGVVDHLALRVDDLEAMLARLRALKVELLDGEPIVVPDLGARIAFCLGPDAERIELIERRVG